MGKPTITQDSEMPESPTPPAFREGGYGWVCVACTFLMNAHTWGINAVRLILPPGQSILPNN